MCVFVCVCVYVCFLIVVSFILIGAKKADPAKPVHRKPSIGCKSCVLDFGLWQKKMGDVLFASWESKMEHVKLRF